MIPCAPVASEKTSTSAFCPSGEVTVTVRKSTPGKGPGEGGPSVILFVSGSSSRFCSRAFRVASPLLAEAVTGAASPALAIPAQAVTPTARTAAARSEKREVPGRRDLGCIADTHDRDAPRPAPAFASRGYHVFP